MQFTGQLTHISYTWRWKVKSLQRTFCQC